jgi:hypothetical protein
MRRANKEFFISTLLTEKTNQVNFHAKRLNARPKSHGKQRAQGYVAPMIRIVSDRDRPINTPHDE